MAAVIEYLDELEIGLCLRINRCARTERVRRFFSVVSRLGDGGFWAAAGVVLFLLHGPASLPVLLQLALTGALGVLVYRLLKQRLVRERPYIANGAIRCGTHPLDRYSFPSGHTLHAVSFTVMFATVEPLLALACVPFAALVAASRVILGLHYPSDVLAGAAIGASLASASLSLL